MAEQDISGGARTILVPVSNPDTCAGLLRLAIALAQPDEGKIIALMITTGDVENKARPYAEIEDMIEQMEAETTCNLELRFHTSTSIARGIVDTVQNEGADLLILGLRHPVRGEVVLGTVVENVLAIAPCDVLVYRAGSKTEFERIVIPVDGSAHAKVACQMGVRLAQHYQVKAEAMYVQESYRPRWEGLGRIEQSLEDVPEGVSIHRTLVTAHDPAEGILARVSDSDLLVVGYSNRLEFERWLSNDFSRQILNRAPAQVILTSRASTGVPLVDNIGRFINRFNLKLTPIEREDILRQAFDTTAFNVDFTALILISATLASLGLLLNSSSVIIGAMLVAPFMQPCIGFAVGLSTARLGLLWRSISALLVGIPLALLVAFVMASFVPGHPSTAEMLARAHPTLLDAAVALASGIMGAYATARKDIPSALAGVAIAAALMPPLCTFGMQMAFGRYDLGLGAGLLFVMNIVFISLAAAGLFLWTGMRPSQESQTTRARIISLGIVALLAVIVLGIFTNANEITRRQQSVENVLNEFFAPGEVTDVQVINDPVLHIQATILTEKIVGNTDISGAEQALVKKLNQPVQLKVVVLPLVTSHNQP